MDIPRIERVGIASMQFRLGEPLRRALAPAFVSGESPEYLVSTNKVAVRLGAQGIESFRQASDQLDEEMRYILPNRFRLHGTFEEYASKRTQKVGLVFPLREPELFARFTNKIHRLGTEADTVVEHTSSPDDPHALIVTLPRTLLTNNHSQLQDARDSLEHISTHPAYQSTALVSFNKVLAGEQTIRRK